MRLSLRALEHPSRIFSRLPHQISTRDAVSSCGARMPRSTESRSGHHPVIESSSAYRSYDEPDFCRLDMQSRAHRTRDLFPLCVAISRERRNPSASNALRAIVRGIALNTLKRHDRGPADLLQPSEISYDYRIVIAIALIVAASRGSSRCGFRRKPRTDNLTGDRLR